MLQKFIHNTKANILWDRGVSGADKTAILFVYNFFFIYKIMMK